MFHSVSPTVGDNDVQVSIIFDIRKTSSPESPLIWCSPDYSPESLDDHLYVGGHTIFLDRSKDAVQFMRRSLGGKTTGQNYRVAAVLTHEERDDRQRELIANKIIVQTIRSHIGHQNFQDAAAKEPEERDDRQRELIENKKRQNVKEAFQAVDPTPEQLLIIKKYPNWGMRQSGGAESSWLLELSIAGGYQLT